MDPMGLGVGVTRCSGARVLVEGASRARDAEGDGDNDDIKRQAEQTTTG